MKKLSFFIVLIFLSSQLISVRDNRLKTINQEIGKIKKMISSLKKEGSSVLNELYGIELQFKKVKKEKSRIDYILARTKKAIAGNKREKKLLEDNIHGLKNKMRKVLRILYKSGATGSFKVFFNVKNIDQLFRNYQLFISLINYNVIEINKIRNLIEKLKKVELQLKHEYKKQIELGIKKKNKLKEIGFVRKKKLDFINRINSDRRKYLSMLSDLKSEAEKLSKVITHESGKIDLPDIDLKKLKGKLNWPVKGTILSGYGKRKSTKFNTFIFNNGIEITPSNSDRIKAVFAGVIIFQNYFKGYGNIVIIQHSKDFLTIYGHCERFLKSKGDFISKGDVIGIIGDSGSMTGKSLYFEIRKGTKAVNPLEWLKR